jgi:hypothetical protein
MPPTRIDADEQYGKVTSSVVIGSVRQFLVVLTRIDQMKAQQRQRAVLEQTRDEYERLTEKYNDLDQVYRELLDQREVDSCKQYISFLLPLK